MKKAACAMLLLLWLAAACGTAGLPSPTPAPPPAATLAATQRAPATPTQTPSPAATLVPTAPGASAGPTAGGGSRILFIGNSHTFTNDLPGMLASLARSGGRAVEVDSSAIGGYTLEQHALDRRTQAKLDRGGWDFVVLQESIRNLSVQELRTAHAFPAVRVLDERIRSQGGSTVLLLMWASITAVDAGGLEGLAAQQAEMAAALRPFAQELGILLAPVGPAWETALRQRPELRLWGGDQHHASSAGTYLMACVLYATLYAESPAGLGFSAGLPADAVQFFQQVAAGAVQPDGHP